MKTRICLFFGIFILCSMPLLAQNSKMSFWDVQRKGANFFPNNPVYERFRDAAEAGIQLARLAPNKWLNGRPENELGDFLLGPKDKYSGIVQKDLVYLVKVLDDADRAGLKVVVTMLSLPGLRTAQHNIVDGKPRQQFDLWKNFKYHRQAASFWRDLAAALKDHPAVVGYNIINEPCPERANHPTFRDWYTLDYYKWYKKIKGTPADLNVFYKTMIKAIRRVDRETPIVLDPGFYANPYALQIMNPKKLKDDKIIYSIHQYSPGRFVNRKYSAKYKYPGWFPTGELDAPGEENAQKPYAPVEYWDKIKIRTFLQVVFDWKKKYRIPDNRIYIGEFGCNREADGVIGYFTDMIDFYSENGWHWSFYAYREDDGFPVMDYELGTGRLSWKYWDSSKDYACEKDGLYKPNPLWDVILEGLK